MPGMISLLALTPHALNRAGLYSLQRFNYNVNSHRLVLQLIIALRDLPRFVTFIFRFMIRIFKKKTAVK